MAIVSRELDPAHRRQIGLRIHPEIRKRLKAAAALAGETMEDHLHRILLRELGVPVFRRDGAPDHKLETGVR